MKNDLILRVKTITPTFMGGGDGRLDGIRIPEIKGMMRWWFRALSGAFLGNKINELKYVEGINELKYVEGSIFGMASDKKNTCRSKFKITIKNKSLKFVKMNVSFEPSGYTYLGIGNVLFEPEKRNDNKKGGLSLKPNSNKADSQGNVLIDADSVFDLGFIFFPQTEREDIDIVAGSFYLATALGGFGLRARKCFGSWQIIGCEGVDLAFNPTDYTMKGIRENIAKIKTVLDKKLKSIHKDKNSSYSPATEYPAIDDSKFVFEVVETEKTNYIDLLNQFGRLYRGFRVCAENPKPGLPARGIHTTDFDFLSRANTPKNCTGIKDFEGYKVRNALFGLNIVYPQLKSNLQLEIPADNGKENVLRRASPVWFSVKEVNNRLNLHIVLFKSRFMPVGAKLKFGNKECKVEDYSLIENKFIPYIRKELRKEMGGKDV